ncbi:mitochondrial escape protein 2 [Pichia californica]|uniref:Mitochondrial escape protein 2 n=1 Tax=Pichia californica TaxID=460514 RepID=A0A9P7BFL2_9ASCO|nr:mitochondrial escape protein 2 [[Candida] californica]KAG0689056.1 mitochondrial escape protein 2 [[Candida] californica]
MMLRGGRYCLVKPLQTIQLRSLTAYTGRKPVNETTIIENSNLGEDTSINDTGFIIHTKNRTTLYIDHICPPKASKWDYRQFISPLLYPSNADSITKFVKDLTNSYQDVQIIPVPRDGGAFVSFKLPAATTPQLYNKSVIYNLTEKMSTSHRFFLRMGIFPVKGVPWVEDMGRYASTTLKVKFEGDELSQESLYAMFRRYGKISDIILPKPGDMDRVALVTFWTTRSAICARHCLTGSDIGGTIVHIHYKKRVNDHWFPTLMRDHPRIAIPLLLGFMAGIAVLIFDPIRSWFIKEKIKGELDWSQYFWFKEIWKGWITTRNRVKGLLSSQQSDDADWGLWSKIDDLMDERTGKAKEVKIWLDENVNSMIVVQGPAGSGKRNLVSNLVLPERDNVLYVDCENIIKSRKDYQLIQNFAHEIGYFPVFSFVSSISSFVDLFVKSLTGQNAGLTETKESQIQSMLTLSLGSIRDLALHNYYQLMSSNENFYMKEEDYLQQNPQSKPVIVIDRYQASRKKNQANSFIYKSLAEWAANLVQLNIAHVIFITDDVGSIQDLITALPTSPLKRVVLSDASEVASNVYVSHALEKDNAIQTEKDQEELENYTKLLGGRMRDLQMFVRRIKSGDMPKEAFQGLTQQAIEQLSQVFLTSAADYGFNVSQAWQVIKLLSQKPEVDYKDVFLLPMFKANTFKVLQSMENAELIRLVRVDGVVTKIIPAKPVFYYAFKEMVNDPEIYRAIEKECLLGKIEFETNRIRKFAEDLGKFKETPEPKLFKERLKYLSGKIEAGTTVINECEQDMAKLKDKK